MLAASQRAWKFLIVAVFVLLVTAVYLQDSTFSTRSKEYFKDFLKTHGASEQSASDVDASFDEPGLNPSFDVPTNPPSELSGVDTDGTTPPVFEDDSGYAHDKTFFELDLQDYPLPSFDASKLRETPPHNYKGPGHSTYALLFTSRNSSIHDPYFLSTHEVIYRLLWKPKTRSKSHPVVIFVAPHITQEIRGSFEAVGAIVREVELLPFHPHTSDGHVLSHRFRDVFTKIRMWSETDFSKIAFIDSDAYPLVNVDALLDDKALVPDQICNPSLLSPEDVAHVDELCGYIFTGARDLGFHSMINAGVMVFTPNHAMYDVLLREMKNTSNFDPGYPEQAFLSYVFREHGPFPAGEISAAWNGDPKYQDEHGDLRILHAKLWILMGLSDHWADGLFMTTWKELLAFYEGEEFARLREMDQVVSEESMRGG